MVTLMKLRNLLPAVLMATSTIVSLGFAQEPNPDEGSKPPVSSASTSTATATPIPSATPRIHHAPISIATPHIALEIDAAIDHPHLVKRAVLVYRAADAKETKEVPFLRSKTDLYVATIPGEEVLPPGLRYAIEIERTDGSRVAAFASRDAMHDVTITEDIADTRERALAERLGGRRAVFAGAFDYVYFGKTFSPVLGQDVTDGYLRAEGSFTYRPLRTVLEFSIRGGIVRGTSLTPETITTADTKVGLNYGAPTVIFRLHDLWPLELEFLTSVTEVGFSGGGGSALHIGEPYGSKLVIGFEAVKTFGTRGYARLDILRGRFRVSPLVEVTDMPHADRAGVRLVTELGVNLGQGWGLLVRGGYQARDFRSGGPGAGLTLSFAF